MSNIKNKIIFKSLMEKIPPMHKIWRLKDFKMESMFDEQAELHLYKACRKVIADLNGSLNENLYNMVRMSCEKLYSDEELTEVHELLDEIEKMILKEEEVEYVKKEIKHYVKEVAVFYTIKESIEDFEKIRNATFSDIKDFYGIFEKFEKAVRINPDAGDDLGINLRNITEKNIDDAMRKGRCIKFPKEFQFLNEATDGGASTKTLNILMGATNIGKSRAMANFAVGYLLQGYNVCYITLELSEEEVLSRILSLLLHKPIKELRKMDKEKLIESFKGFMKSKGIDKTFLIKEFPSGEFTTDDLKDYIQEAKMLEKDERPVIYFVDGINNMEANGFKGTNSYFKMKDIAHKLHGIAKKEDLMLWVAAQMDKSTFKKIGNDITKTQEGWSIPQAADFCIIIEEDDEFLEKNIQVVKIDKSRYAKKPLKPFFIKLESVELFNLNGIDTASEEYTECVNAYNAITKKGGSKFDWE